MNNAEYIRARHANMENKIMSQHHTIQTLTDEITRKDNILRAVNYLLICFLVAALIAATVWVVPAFATEPAQDPLFDQDPLTLLEPHTETVVVDLNHKFVQGQGEDNIQLYVDGVGTGEYTARIHTSDSYPGREHVIQDERVVINNAITNDVPDLTETGSTVTDATIYVTGGHLSIQHVKPLDNTPGSVTVDLIELTPVITIPEEIPEEIPQPAEDLTPLPFIPEPAPPIEAFDAPVTLIPEPAPVVEAVDPPVTVIPEPAPVEVVDLPVTVIPEAAPAQPVLAQPTYNG